MKRLIAVGILLLLLISVFLTSLFYIKNTCEKTEILLTECVNAYEQKGDISKRIEDLEKFWDKKEKVLSVFADHNSIDEIELSIKLLAVYSHTSQKELFLEYSKRAKIALHQLLEDTYPGTHSIL